MLKELVVTKQDIDLIIAESRQSKRKRYHRLFRSADREIPAVMFNAFQKGTYVTPHKHPPDGKEIWIAHKGKIRAILFDKKGKVEHTYDLSPTKTIYLEIPGGKYHSAIPLEDNSVLCELYLGFFKKETYKTFALWAPHESESQEKKKKYLKNLLRTVDCRRPR